MKLIVNGAVIYNGRVLCSSEISAYKNNMANVVVVYTHAEIVECRQLAYKAESDPLYMEWKFDQTSESELIWRAKVVEIKQRYPLPAVE